MSTIFCNSLPQTTSAKECLPVKVASPDENTNFHLTSDHDEDMPDIEFQAQERASCMGSMGTLNSGDEILARALTDGHPTNNNSTDHQQFHHNLHPTNFHGLFPPLLPTNPDPKGSHQSNINSQFFEREHHGSLGAASIAAQALFHSRDLAEHMHPSSVLWSMLLTWLSTNLSNRQREVLAVLLHYAQSFTPPPSGFKPLHVPESPNELNTMFISGSRSILKNLPHPEIQQLIDGHVYISLVDIIRDLVGHGRHVESLSYNSNTIHAQSVRGQEILRAASMVAMDVSSGAQPKPGDVCGTSPRALILPIYLWRDGFDPFNVKKNKASAWCMFASIGTPQSRIHSSINTYLSALGPSSSSHGLVEKHLLEDLQLLSSGKLKMYDGKSKTVVPIFAQVYSIQEDRPEKGSHTYTAAGNSTYHARFGYAGDILSVKDRLPSCKSCLQARLEGSTTLQLGCTNCLDWQFDHICYPVPKDYPKSSVDVTDGKIPFKRIDFGSLQAALAKSHINVESGSWSVTQAKCFLATEGVSTDLANKLVENAVRCRTYYREMEDTSTTLEGMGDPLTEEDLMYRDEMIAKYYDPERVDQHQMIPFPSSWAYPNSGLREWIETIMHQLFLGVTKSTFKDFINAWLRSNRKFATFVVDCNPKINTVKQLCLDYCKAECITNSGGFGKYVSENYLAFARMSKWLYGNLDSLQVSEQYRDPPKDKCFTTYSVKEARNWLKARHIEFPDQAKKSTLLTIITQAINQNPLGQWPPIHVEDDRRNAPVIVIERVISSFLAMLSRIMIRGVITREQSSDCDRHVKLFLSQFDALLSYHASENSSNSGKNSPDWLSKYNFITLLNIPDCMLRYGSLRLLFEGDGKGEGALPLLKEVISSFRGNWAANAATKYYHKRSIKEVISSSIANMPSSDRPTQATKQMLTVAKSLVSSEQSATGEKDWMPTSTDGISRSRYKAFVTYLSSNDVIQRILNRSPVSIILSSIGYLAAIKESQLVCLTVGQYVRTTCGAAYFQWHALPNAIPQPNGFFSTMVLSYGILLPCPLTKEESDSTPSYYLVTSDWQELLADGSVDMPQSPGAFYNSVLPMSPTLQHLLQEPTDSANI